MSINHKMMIRNGAIHLQGLKDILSVLAPFILGLVTSYLSDRRSTRHDSHIFLVDDYQSVINENRELRKENEKLRKELQNDN